MPGSHNLAVCTYQCISVRLTNTHISGSEHFLLQLQANNMSDMPNNFQEDVAYNKREPLVLNRMSSSVLRRFQKSIFWGWGY